MKERAPDIDAGAASPSAIELARRALDLATTDPRAASGAAERALASPSLTPDAEAVARRALGLVAREGNDLRSSAEQLRLAVRVAEAGGLPRLAAEARMSLAPTLAMQGDGDAALAECDKAAAVLTGVARARLEAQRAGLLELVGRTEEALAAYQWAIPTLRRAGDRLWETRARHNRGLLHLKRGDVAKARTELAAAEQLLAPLGSDAARVHLLDHLARLEALTGDLPAALARFAQIDEILISLDAVDPLGLIDRCAVLLSARLGEEAEAAARLAVDESQRAGDEHDLAQARLALAEALLLTGAPEPAVTEATTAAAAFRRQHAAQWAARAGLVAVQARWASGERSHRLLTLARASAAGLERATWTDAAAEARLLAGQVALELDRPRVARPELELAARVRGASPALTRIRAWHAVALLRQLDGNRRGVTSALRTGLRIVDAHRATLGATELRARAAGHGAELAALGLRRALADGSATEVLTWAERFRAGTLALAPAPPAQDPALLRDLAELRRLATEIEAAALAGDDIAPLRRRQVALEAAVSRLVRTVQGRNAVFTRTLDVDQLASTLADRVLVELVEEGGWLHAVIVGHGDRPVLAALAPSSSVRSELDAARFALRRLALGRGSAASLAAARVALAESAARLDAHLLGPVRDAIGEHPLVVVPTGVLHVLPWSTLPALTGRPVTIAPSAGLWLDSERQTRSRSRRRRVVLVAGPGLPGAPSEIAALARRYRNEHPVRLSGRNATASAVTTALDGATLAHVAAHGRFRADNPLFSALELADGPLTVHDLESVRRPPDTLILSACDSGLSSVHPGDELLGLAAGLLGLGTRSLVASLLPVPDQATRALMIDLHARLRAGNRPADALAGAQASAFAAGDDASLAAAASFVCVGRG